MFPIFIFTGMGAEPQNAFLPPCSCFRRKQKTADAVCRSGLSCEKRIPENPQIFRNSNIKNNVSAEYGQSATEAIQNRIC